MWGWARTEGDNVAEVAWCSRGCHTPYAARAGRPGLAGRMGRVGSWVRVSWVWDSWIGVRARARWICRGEDALAGDLHVDAGIDEEWHMRRRVIRLHWTGRVPGDQTGHVADPEATVRDGDGSGDVDDAPVVGEDDRRSRTRVRNGNVCLLCPIREVLRSGDYLRSASENCRPTGADARAESRQGLGGGDHVPATRAARAVRVPTGSANAASSCSGRETTAYVPERPMDIASRRPTSV